MEEDVEIDLLLKSNKDILEEAADLFGNEANVEIDDIDKSLIHRAKLTSSGLEILSDECGPKQSLKRKNARKKNSLQGHRKKRKLIHKNENCKEDVPLDELQQQLDDHMISIITQEPEKHVFSQIYSDESSVSDDDNDERPGGTSKGFINEFTAEDELPYRGTFVEEMRRQVGSKGKKQPKCNIFRDLNHAQRLLLKRDELLTKFEVKLQEDIAINKARQTQIQETISSLSGDEGYRSVKQPSFTKNFYKKFGIPYFEDAKGFTSPPNLDVIRKNNSNELNLLSVPKVYYWTKDHNDTLLKCIKNTIKEEKTDRIKKEIFRLKESLKPNIPEYDLKCKIEEFQQELRDVQKQSFHSLVSKENPDREYDWMKYAAMHFNNVHSADECRRFWHGYLKPTVNKSSWTLEEDMKLIDLVQQMHGEDWDNVARLLGTNRSPYQCFIHYQTRIDVKNQYSRGRWTKAEDESLIKIVNMSRHGDYIPWTKVAAHFPNRSHCQVYCRWKYCLDPKLIKGKFSKEEDVLVVSGIEIFGANYNEIATLLGNRSASQVRDRYERHLLPKRSNIGTWSVEEDSQLLELVKVHGRKWINVSKEMGTRSRTQVRQRYNAIQHLMKVNPNWTVETAKRVHRNVDLAKDLKKTWRIVDKLKKEIDEIEQSFNLSHLEKETFRIEKLKELKDSIMMNKYNAKRRKKVLHGNSDCNNLLIEYFKPSYNHAIVKPIMKPRDIKDSKAYLNEMIMITRYLGFELDIPKSEQEIRNNARLNKHLKYVLRDTLPGPENSDLEIPNSTSDITAQNIDYIPPPTDESIVMNEWWFSLSIDLSRLNFSEILRKSIFNYSSGMHEDIWNSRMSRTISVISSPKPVVSKQSFQILPPLIPSNFLTTTALRTLILSKIRLKRDVSEKGFSRYLKVKTPFQEPGKEDSLQVKADQSTSTVEESSGQIITYEEKVNLMKMCSHFLHTLSSLLCLPRMMSFEDTDATPYGKHYLYHSTGSKAKVAVKKVLSLINDSKVCADKDDLELKVSHKHLHDHTRNRMKSVFNRNIEVKRSRLAHRRGNKCLRKMKIEHLLKKETKKSPLPKARKIKKSKDGLCPDQRIICKKMKLMQTKSEPADFENNENWSIQVPDVTYKRKADSSNPSCSSYKDSTTHSKPGFENNENLFVRFPNVTYERKAVSRDPSCSSSQNSTSHSNVGNEIVVQHEGITIFKRSCVPKTGTVDETVNKIDASRLSGIEVKGTGKNCSPKKLTVHSNS